MAGDARLPGRRRPAWAATTTVTDRYGGDGSFDRLRFGDDTSAKTTSSRGDAQEYGLHVKQGGWRLGLLVARSVEKGTAAHRPVSRETGEKVSAREFAEQSGASPARVLRHLDAWERASVDGQWLVSYRRRNSRGQGGASRAPEALGSMRPLMYTLASRNVIFAI